jgi:hypothetical protein
MLKKNSGNNVKRTEKRSVSAAHPRGRAKKARMRKAQVRATGYANSGFAASSFLKWISKAVSCLFEGWQMDRSRRPRYESARLELEKRITFKDFKTALKTSFVDEVVQDRMFAKFSKARPALEHLIDKSFLDPELKVACKELVMKKFRQIGLDSSLHHPAFASRPISKILPQTTKGRLFGQPFLHPCRVSQLTGGRRRGRCSWRRRFSPDRRRCGRSW